MLNYIWLSLIVIGIIAAVSVDITDLSTDKYCNDKELPVVLNFNLPVEDFEINNTYNCTLKIPASEFNHFYSVTVDEDISQKAEIFISEKNRGTIKIFLDNNTPDIWNQIANAQKKEAVIIQGKFQIINETENDYSAFIVLNPVKFIKMNAVTNEGIVKYAKIAVELAIGLIGIMALWLGVMKIAEASGMITKLANLLKPITTRLFPDVPADHPAMGAMIMNISANILGLANAATPLGLKAMEELNKLNRKLGTASDAMCTFLVINTSNVQLIPATVIAIRSAAGSSNPTEIIGAVIVATSVSTIVGVTVVKLLARLKIFKKQLDV